MIRLRFLVTAAILTTFLAVIGSLSTGAIDGIPGTGTLSGMVTAARPFRAAQVHLKNRDRNMLYVVFTRGGHYKAINLLPGDYEVWVEKKGFTSDISKSQINA